MKNARIVLMAALGLATFATLLPADPDDTDPSMQVDRDGVPLSISKPLPAQLTPDEVAEIRKKQAEANLDKDWLIRDYEKQLKMNAAGDPSGTLGNLYYQLSTNKDLAKLAGLPDLDDEAENGTSINIAGGMRSVSESAPSHPTSLPTGSILASSSYLRPFITPLTTPNGDELSGFYSAAVGGRSPSNGSASARAPASALNASENPAAVEDPSDIETPGMVAADKNPNPELDLSLDVLPGESIEHARDHQDNDQLLTLPLPMSADQLHRQEAASLGTPGSVGPAQASATTQAPKPVPINDDNEPIPASKAPVINPVRAPIANPFDILNR